MGPDLPSLCVWGPGLGAAPSALSKDVCALGEWSKGDGGQDGSSEQAHPQETTLLRSFLSWFRILQTKLPRRLGLQLHRFGLYYKSYKEK